MSDSEEDWEEIGGEEECQKCPCLFCDEVQCSGDETMTHCMEKHDVDLQRLRRSLCT